MKKIALFALLVSVAHAVTINWQMAILGTDANGNTKLGSYAGIVVLAGHMTSVPAYKDAFEIHNNTVQANDGINVLVKGLDNVLGVAMLVVRLRGWCARITQMILAHKRDKRNCISVSQHILHALLESQMR